MKKFHKLITPLLIAAAVLVAVLGMVLYILFQPVGDSPATQSFVIPKGQAISIIAQRLTDQGLIRHPYIFRLIVKVQGLENKLQAGSFDLANDMSVREIAQKLTEGTNDLWVTIPEGWRREEIADSLANQDLEDFDKEEFLLLTAGQEGRLFPDSYLVPKLATAQYMADLLTSTFTTKVEIGLEKEIAASPYDFEDVLVMASIIERESQDFNDMRKVAGVLWNRIDIGMALQADATLQYAKGYSRTQKSWWIPPLAADKALVSPFNTYQNPGLPPKPICNPGLNAIKAALNPAQVDFLYYLHDNQGTTHFATTFEGHQANINRHLQ